MPNRSLDFPVAAAADFAACRASLRGGSRTFHAASLLLPRSVRRPASALYAFCRLADDVVDVSDGGLPAIARLRERLDRVYDGRPYPTSLDRAFADVVTHYEIPRTLLDALLEGFAWDAAGRSYEDFPALCEYAARVAGTVGAMMTLLMGTRRYDTLARACDLGVAMQLSNIARDVGEDARAGRLYLPLRWLREEGVDPDAWLARPEPCEGVARVVKRLVGAAEALYVRSASGISQLPMACRPGINAARVLYGAIGREVARKGCTAIGSRTVVSTRRKVSLILLAAPGAFALQRQRPMPPLAETAFLVESAARETAGSRPHGTRASGPLAWWSVSERVVRTIDLFARLERRDRHRSLESAD